MITKRGQISIEYLIVLGFATFAITGIIGLAFYYINTTDDQMKANHINNFANSIIDNAESVYYAGPPSKISISPYLPKGVESVEVVLDSGKSYIIITYRISSGQNIIGFTSKVPLDTTSVITSTDGIKNLVLEFDASNSKIKITQN